ncbi:MAG TPA: hypothetical protein VF532_15720 [Candidatus Angelobacter sp.]
MAQRRKSVLQISYVTITYRSVAMAMLAVLLLAAAVMYFAFPDLSNRWVASTQTSMGKLLEKMGVGASSGMPLPEPGPQQAHFTNIDGNVRVRKANSSVWVPAEYGLALDRNDIVQTWSQGMAKIVLADGTNYTVKPDSLIVIQENSVNAQQESNVAVQVKTGTVDLATSNFGRGSKSEVIVSGGATANMKPDSAAQVMSDSHNDQILVKKGGADVTRGSQTVPMADYDKLIIPADDSKAMVKSKEIRPPFLISPRDKDTYQADPKTKDVLLTWGPVEGVRVYRVRMAKNKFFAAPLVVDVKDWPNLEMKVKNLEPGQTYYWQVLSVGEGGKESVASETNGFTLALKGDSSTAILLELEPFSQHGHVIEVKGRTEPGARVMVNGQEAITNADGTFRHFTNPLPTGDNMITVTAQNQKGGWNTKPYTVTIQ